MTSGDVWADPNGASSHYFFWTGTSSPESKPLRPIGYVETSIGYIAISSHRKCANDGSMADNPGMNNYAIQLALEGGGVYCLDG